MCRLDEEACLRCFKMIKEVFNYGALPTLARVVQFTEKRQQVIAHNIANINTPRYVAKDLDVSAFQKSLRGAIDRRRGSVDPVNGALHHQDSRNVEFHKQGLNVKPVELNRNVLFHDRGNRNLERQMQDMVENVMVHTAALRMLKSRMDTLGQAVRLRV